MFFFTGLLFWARVIDPGPLRPQLQWPARIAYVVGAMVVGWMLAITLVLVQQPLYRHYALLAHRPGGISALTDQQLAGGMMWVPGSISYTIADDDRRLPLARARPRAPPASHRAHHLRRTDSTMPPLPFADNFLAGSLLTLLLPIGLLIAIAVWYVRTVKHVPEDTPESSAALPSSEVLAAARRGQGSRAPPPTACRRGLMPGVTDALRSGTTAPAPHRAAGGVLLAVLCGAARRRGRHAGCPRPAALPARAAASSALRRAGDLGGRRARRPGHHHPGDQTGHRFSLAALRGRTVAIEFLDSHCNQECPLAGRALAAAERSLAARATAGARRGQRQPARHAGEHPRGDPAVGLGGAAPWHWLMGTHAQLGPCGGPTGSPSFRARPTSATPRRCT